MGRTSLIEHEINTGDSVPIKQKQFRIPQTVQGELDNQIHKMLKNDLIEPSTSPWCSPVMIVKQKKRDGSFKYRFITDMRKVNEVTIKDAYPLPRIDQALDQLGGLLYFTVLDLARGFYQVRLKASD